MYTRRRREIKNGHKTKTKKTHKKTNTICAGHHYAQTHTNNINKTWALQQATGGKDEPNFVFMRKLLRTHSTNVKTHNRTTKQLKRWGEVGFSRKKNYKLCRKIRKNLLSWPERYKRNEETWNYSFQQDIMVQFEEKNYRLSYKKNHFLFVLREKVLWYLRNITLIKMLNFRSLKAYSSSNWFFFILKVANIRCFILIAVEIFHYIIRK